MKRGFWSLIFLAALPAWAAAAPHFVGEAYQQVALTGYTRSAADVSLSAEVTGKVLDVAYDVGDVVGKAAFVRIDPTFVDFSIGLARRGIQRLDAALAGAESRIVFLGKEFERIDALFRKNSTTEQSRDQLRQELDQAVLESRALLAEKAAEQIRLNELMERRRRHDIYAPEGWIVTERLVDPGEIVGPSTRLASVGDYRRLVVPLSVTPAELSALRALRTPFAARLDRRPAKAAIGWVNPEFDENTRKLAVEISIVRWDGEHRGGLVMTLSVEVPAPGLSVPKAAVVNRFENPRVRLKDTGEEIQIIVLGETDSRLRIAENERLRPGMALLPAETP